tara:strand:+ start:4401 stop:4634 length:234 start_codon:yes stop_codon:yes gene_type:complete
MSKKLNLKDEEDVMDRSKAREIIQVVLDHGVNQSQIYHMVYLLALELENQENTKKITKLINQITKQPQKESSLITGE